MTLALNPAYPLLDLFWTMLLVFGLAVFLCTLVVVFRDLFGRSDLAWWGKTLWVVVLLVFPLVASLGYLIAQSGPMAQRRLAREGGLSTQLGSDAHLHTVAGSGGFRGTRDVARADQAWSGPIRPA